MTATRTAAKRKPTQRPIRARRSVRGSAGSSYGILAAEYTAGHGAGRPRLQSGAVTSRRTAPTATRARPRHRPSLAPEHLGEAASAAVLVVGVAGTAVLITGVAMVVMGLTMGARYSADPPPDLATLGLAPALAGAGLVILGGGLVGGALAVLSDVRGARVVTGILAVVAAALSALGAVLAMVSIPADPLAATALTIMTGVFGVSAILLLRPARQSPD